MGVSWSKGLPNHDFLQKPNFNLEQGMSTVSPNSFEVGEDIVNGHPPQIPTHALYMFGLPSLEGAGQGLPFTPDLGFVHPEVPGDGREVNPASSWDLVCLRRRGRCGTRDPVA